MNFDAIQTMVTTTISNLDVVKTGELGGGIILVLALIGLQYSKKKKKKRLETQTESYEGDVPLIKGDTRELEAEVDGLTIDTQPFDGVSSFSGVSGFSQNSTEAHTENKPKSLWKEDTPNLSFVPRSEEPVVEAEKLDSNDLLENAIDFDRAGDKEHAYNFLLEAIKNAPSEREKLRLRVISQNYRMKFHDTNVLEQLASQLPSFAPKSEEVSGQTEELQESFPFYQDANTAALEQHQQDENYEKAVQLEHIQENHEYAPVLNVPENVQEELFPESIAAVIHEETHEQTYEQTHEQMAQESYLQDAHAVNEDISSIPTFENNQNLSEFLDSMPEITPHRELHIVHDDEPHGIPENAVHTEEIPAHMTLPSLSEIARLEEAQRTEEAVQSIESVSPVHEEKPVIQDLHSPEKVQEIIEQLAQDAKEHDELVENDAKEADSKFWNAFSSTVSELHENVHDTTPAIIEEPKNSTIWVNWMMQVNGKTAMRNGYFEIEGVWGTKSSIEQLKVHLNQENGNANWALLTIFVVKD